MPSGSPLFSLAIRNPPLEAVYQIVEVLGELPPHLKLVQFNEDGYLELDGCENRVDLSGDVEEFPLDLHVKDIKAERISPFFLLFFPRFVSMCNPMVYGRPASCFLYTCLA